MKFSNKLKKILNDKKSLAEILDEFEIKLTSIKRIKDFNKFPRYSIYGFIDYEKQTIYVEKNLDKEEQEITILHELLHEHYKSKNENSINKLTMKIWWDKKYNRNNRNLYK